MTIKACIMGIAALLPAYTAANAQAMYFDNAKVGEVTPDTIIIVETPAEKTLAATKPQATAATEAIADTSALYRGNRPVSRLNKIYSARNYNGHRTPAVLLFPSGSIRPS